MLRCLPIFSTELASKRRMPSLLGANVVKSKNARLSWHFARNCLYCDKAKSYMPCLPCCGHMNHCHVCADKYHVISTSTFITHDVSLLVYSCFDFRSSCLEKGGSGVEKEIYIFVCAPLF